MRKSISSPSRAAFWACDSKHLGRLVDCGHSHAALSQDNGVASCPGSYVYSIFHRHLIEDALHSRLFRGNQGIHLEVVGLSPRCIPFDCIGVGGQYVRTIAESESEFGPKRSS